MADPPEGAVRPVEGQVARPDVFEQDRGLARVDVHPVEAPPAAAVVGRVEQGARLGVVGQRGDVVERGGGHLGDLAHLPAVHVDRHDVGELAGVVDRGVERPPPGVEVAARHRAQRPLGQGLEGGHGVLAHRPHVGPLPPLLPLDPLLPLAVQLDAEDVLELRPVGGLAALVPPEPGDHLVRTVPVGEVADEAGAVEVGHLARLEVDGLPLGLEADRVVEVGPVGDHGPEDHLVVAPSARP